MSKTYYNTGSIDFLSDADRKRLIESASRYDKDEFELYVSEAGWQDWLEDFVSEDEEEPDEKEVETINIVLRQAWDIAMEQKDKIRQIRDLSGMRRKDFAEKYNIPIRTIEDWESGRSNAPAYVKDLLERAVREDFGLPRIYSVYSIASGRVDEEFEIMKTASKSEALKRARKEREINQRDNQPEQIEVRLYEKDIDDPDCECYDYEVVEF